MLKSLKYVKWILWDPSWEKEFSSVVVGRMILMHEMEDQTEIVENSEVYGFLAQSIWEFM